MQHLQEIKDLRCVQARGEHSIRFADIITALNAGRVLFPDLQTFPEHAGWCKPMVERLVNYTGERYPSPDDLCALNSAFEELTRTDSTDLAEHVVNSLRQGLNMDRGVDGGPSKGSFWRADQDDTGDGKVW
jgi:hypothetical protein